MALEATTGWRFVVEELRAVGAGVHLAEPAETARCAGTRSGRRAIARTPGICASCWWPGGCRSRGSRPITSSICVPRSGCGTRWWTSAASGSSGSRPCSITTAARSGGELMTRRRAATGWHAALPAAAREQITVALQMIDALDALLAPIDKELRAYARRQTGCRALIGRITGSGS